MSRLVRIICRSGTEIIAIVDKVEYQKLMNYISREDPHAFITVYTVSDIRYQPEAVADKMR